MKHRYKHTDHSRKKQHQRPECLRKSDKIRRLLFFLTECRLNGQPHQKEIPYRKESAEKITEKNRDIPLTGNEKHRLHQNTEYTHPNGYVHSLSGNRRVNLFHT